MGQTFELEETEPSPNGFHTEQNLLSGYLPELDEMRRTVTRFVDMEPADVLMQISAISGRLAEMRANLQRFNSPRCMALRTREVDPLREELDLQFRVHSRRIALMEWEYKMSTGAV